MSIQILTDMLFTVSMSFRGSAFKPVGCMHVAETCSDSIEPIKLRFTRSL